MARPSLQALAPAAAGVSLLLLSGCGTAAAPDAPGSPSAAAAALTTRFCSQASNFMRNIPAEPNARHLTAVQARANMSAVLVSTVQGFTGLEKAAPARLGKPLRQIVAVYRADERMLRTTGDMAKVSQSMVQGDGSGSAAFQQVLTYISGHCR
jgi:hypothetical protein